MKERGQPISALTAYDHLMATLLDQAGIDLILVGDSAAMTIQGRHTTVSVTMEQMLYHASTVSSARRCSEVASTSHPRLPHAPLL